VAFSAFYSSLRGQLGDELGVEGYILGILMIWLWQ